MKWFLMLVLIVPLSLLFSNIQPFFDGFIVGGETLFASLNIILSFISSAINSFINTQYLSLLVYIFLFINVFLFLINVLRGTNGVFTDSTDDVSTKKVKKEKKESKQ